MTPKELMLMNSVVGSGASNMISNPMVAFDKVQKPVWLTVPWTRGGNPEVNQNESYVPPEPPPPTPVATVSATVSTIRTAVKGQPGALFHAISITVGRIKAKGNSSLTKRISEMFPVDAMVFAEAASSYYPDIFTTPFPSGKMFSDKLVPSSNLSGPKQRVILPFFMSLPVIDSLNSTMTSLGREQYGDVGGDLIAANNELNTLISNNLVVSVLASCLYNDFGIYRNLGWSALLQYYGNNNIKSYYVSTNGIADDVKAIIGSTNEVDRMNAFLDLVEPISKIMKSTILLADAQNKMVELSVSRMLVNAADSPLGDAMFSQEMKTAIAQANEASSNLK